jgi:nucleotide-binding universal stress UspA family protein
VYRNIPQAQHVMDRASRILAEAGVAAPERLYRTGKPYDTILAEAHRADVLVMHRLDASGLAERLRGSMTERLARHAPCHVWLIDPHGPRRR